MEALGELSCTVNIETVAKNGQSQKKKNFQQTQISLGRDQFEDILLRIGSTESILMKDITILKRFAREGKCTIQVAHSSQNIYLSNCPPQKLATFLKVLTIKQGIKKSFATDRVKLLSSKPKEFQEISPLTVQDVKQYKQKQGIVLKSPARKQENTSMLTEITPVRRTSNGISSRNINSMQLANVTPVRTGKRGLEVSTDSNPSKKAKSSSMPIYKLGSSNNNPTPKTPTNLDSVLSTKIVKGDSTKKINVNGKLTDEQKDILKYVRQGCSLFFTGSAGTGKSYLLKRIIGSLPPEFTIATASTGVAACQIGAITLHSFAGIGSGEASVERCIELASRPRVARNWRRCKTLIIDEISMVDGEFFEKLEEVSRAVRNNDLPFGGIQLVLSGDFLQLPPVCKKGENKKFCFQSKRWSECISMSFELTEVKRQNDQQFISLLQYVRVGKCPDSVYERLQATKENNIESGGICATQLCTHKVSVDQINIQRMAELKGEMKEFLATDSDPSLTEQLNSSLLVHEKLYLKVGAQVMLAKNLDVQQGLVNGARGVVVKFQMDKTGLPVVRFTNRLEMPIRQEKFLYRTIGGIASRRQLPLKLAWAISIHKSQGLTLDCCEVSLSRVFEHGQAYVALSRAKSLEGLRVLDMNRNCVKAHPEVLKFYIKLRREIRMMKVGEKENEVEEI